jgi:enoyl-CoA hydratase/carnithine racemase
MSHIYWSASTAGDVAVIRSLPHRRRTLTIAGAAQLVEAVNTWSSAEVVPPLVVELDVDHAELLEVREMSQGRPIADWAPWVEAIDALENYPNLVIASVPRQASCGGLELALAADVRVARADATLGLFETRMGILPGCGGTQRLPRLVGPGHAALLVLSGEPISGERAEQIGLVQEIADDPTEWAIGFAQRCSQNGSDVLITAKHALRAAQSSLADGLRVEGRAFLKLVNQPTADQHITEWLGGQKESE